MLVQNLNGTADLECKCGSWLNHWKNFTKEFSYKCAADDCNEPAHDGSHVIKAYDTDKKHYIIPLCKSCNHRTGAFQVTTSLAPANKSETCNQ